MAAKIFFDLPGGLKMPGVGIGTWQSTDEKELEVALNHALEIGYRHIDTAFAYDNEHVIGRVLKSWLSQGKLKREDLFITTKLPVYGITPDKVEYYLKESLKKLQLDYVDLYLIHFSVYLSSADGKSLQSLKAQPTDHLGVWKKMEEQVDAGRTRTIGLSNFNKQQIAKIVKNARIKPANLQVELHVNLQQRELVNFCHENGITVVAYAPLGSPGYNKFMEERFGLDPKPLPNILKDPKVAAIAKKHSKTNAQVLLRFLLQKSIAVIPKSVTPARLEENINVFDFALDSDDMKQLDNLEIGEKARIADFKIADAITDHPEFPFK